MARELREVVYVDGVRTAFGKAGPGGLFWKTRADDMAVKAVRELLRRNPQAPPERIGDVVMAATAQVGDQGLTLGRDVALLAGLPHTVPGFAVDRMCAGALTAVTAAAGEIAMGACDLAIAGGVEHMGHHPMGDDVDFNPRFVAERLIDESAAVMGQTAENLHDAFPQLTKEDADRYAAESQRRAAAAWAEPDGVYARTVVPMSVFTDEGWKVAERDEFLRPDTTIDGLAGLRTPFRAGGRVTAGNSAGLTDGATASLLASEAVAAELGLEPRMRLVGFAYAGVEPHLMGLGPGPGDDAAPRARGPHDRRHRALRAERAVRGAGADLVRRRRRRTRRPAPQSRTAARSPAAIRSRRPASASWRSSRTASSSGRTLATASPRSASGSGWAPRSSGRTRAVADTPVTRFHLQKLHTHVGPIALVTIDNGADWRKPNTFGADALASLAEVLGQPAHARLARPRPHGQAARLRRGRRHHAVPGDHARARPRRRQGGPRAVRPAARAAVPDARGRQRRGARRRARDRAPLRRPHRRLERPPPRLPRGLPGALPRLGRDAADAAARGRRGRRPADRGQPPEAEPPDPRRGGARARARRPRPRAGRVPRRVDRAPAPADRGGRGQARARGRPLRRGRGRPQGARPGRRRGARPGARAVPRARPDRGRRDRGASRRATPRRRTRSQTCSQGPRRRPRSTRSTSSSGGSGSRPAFPTRSRGRCRRSASSEPA